MNWSTSLGADSNTVEVIPEDFHVLAEQPSIAAAENAIQFVPKMDASSLVDGAGVNRPPFTLDVSPELNKLSGLAYQKAEQVFASLPASERKRTSVSQIALDVYQTVIREHVTSPKQEPKVRASVSVPSLGKVSFDPRPTTSNPFEGLGIVGLGDFSTPPEVICTFEFYLADGTATAASSLVDWVVWQPQSFGNLSGYLIVVDTRREKAVLPEIVPLPGKVCNLTIDDGAGKIKTELVLQMPVFTTFGCFKMLYLPKKN
jgi:hypothetical protein